MSFQLLVAIFELQWGEVIRVAFVFMLTLKGILSVNSLAFRGDSGPLYCPTRFFRSLANQWHGEPNCSHQTSQDCQWKPRKVRGKQQEVVVNGSCHFSQILLL